MTSKVPHQLEFLFYKKYLDLYLQKLKVKYNK